MCDTTVDFYLTGHFRNYCSSIWTTKSELVGFTM